MDGREIDVVRVIQWGTGNVGKHALRAIINRADLELVGVKVYSEEKRGLDAGELIGVDPVGIKCVVDLEDVLAIDADCVVFCGLGSTLPEQFDATIDLFCTLLRNGFNVTASSMEQLIHPVIVPEAMARLSEACAEGKTSFYDTGINPGYAMDLWPITLSRLSRSIDQLRVTEVVDMSRYEDEVLTCGRRQEEVVESGETHDRLHLPGRKPRNAHEEGHVHEVLGETELVADTPGFPELFPVIGRDDDDRLGPEAFVDPRQARALGLPGPVRPGRPASVARRTARNPGSVSRLWEGCEGPARPQSQGRAPGKRTR